MPGLSLRRRDRRYMLALWPIRIRLRLRKFQPTRHYHHAQRTIHRTGSSQRPRTARLPQGLCGHFDQCARVVYLPSWAIHSPFERVRSLRNSDDHLLHHLYVRHNSGSAHLRTSDVDPCDERYLLCLTIPVSADVFWLLSCQAQYKRFAGLLYCVGAVSRRWGSSFVVCQAHLVSRAQYFVGIVHGQPLNAPSASRPDRHLAQFVFQYLTIQSALHPLPVPAWQSLLRLHTAKRLKVISQRMTCEPFPIPFSAFAHGMSDA